MKIRLTEQQFKQYLKYQINEKIKGLGDDANKRIKDKETELAKELYGDEYGKVDNDKTQKYFKNVGKKQTVDNSLEIPTGLFSKGNSKLSPDTLIINFFSALECPAAGKCPVTQAACYAVGIENQHPEARRKNLMIQKAVVKCIQQKKLDKFFAIIEQYIDEYAKTKNKIRYIRYNEVGDFPVQSVLDMAADFSAKMRIKYGILSMAYTANMNLDPSKMIDGKPIDQIIKINRSRSDIKKSEGAVNQTFYGIPMPVSGFSANPDENLANAYCDVVEVTDSEANKLKIERPLNNEDGLPSIPVLNYGKWQSGSGYYYVCPCSFWRYNKDKAIELFLKNNNALNAGETLPDNATALWNLIGKRLPIEKVKELKRILNKIKSPCGTKCAVCHNMEGGVTADGKQSGIKDYVVLTATHGKTKDAYNPEYAEKKRNGDDTAIYSTTNQHGRERKYSTDAAIRSELLKEKIE